jgi:hypothetical protein
VADVGHRGQVVADEEIAHAQRPLPVLELVDDLGSHRHVEGPRSGLAAESERLTGVDDEVHRRGQGLAAPGRSHAGAAAVQGIQGREGGISDVLAQRRGVVGDDPLPYGLARNRKAMEAAIRFACDQKRRPRRVTPEEMLARNTLDLE